jgi:hypothetical protein
VPVPTLDPVAPTDIVNRPWPTDEEPLPTFAPANTKHVYVAASNSTIIPPVPPLYVCDGTNDEAEINDAIADAAGGVVELLDGDFKLGNRVTLRDHTTLKGQGSSFTRLRVRGSDPEESAPYYPIAASAEYVNIVGFALQGQGFVMVTASHVRVEDVTATSILDGERYKAAGNGMFFVWVAGAKSVVEDVGFSKCIAYDCSTHGWNMNQDYSDRVCRMIRNVKLVNCRAELCGHGIPGGSRSEWITGFDFHEWQDLEDLTVLSCVAINNWESGFHLEPGARYLEPPGPRTISKNVTFMNCQSEGNGQRNTYSSHFFMSGYYLSRDTRLSNCTSSGNANSGFYVHGGESCYFNSCTDDGSLYGWKICKASSNITLRDCRSENNGRWGFWASFSTRIDVGNMTVANSAGFRGYLNNLGWYKDEKKYQIPVTNSRLEISATPRTGLPIINREGSGNVYLLSYVG